MRHHVARNYISALLSYTYRMESSLRSGFVGRLPVTLEMRSSINNPRTKVGGTDGTTMNSRKEKNIVLSPR